MIAIAQKWGGVQRNTIRKSATAARSVRPVTAAQPTSGGIAPGRAADHDVLGRAALEPDRVDQHVAEEAGERPEGGRPVHQDAEPEHARETERAADHERVACRDAAARDRTVGRAGHAPVDVAVVPVVQHARAARGQAEARHGRDEQPGAGPAVRREPHRADGRDHDQQQDLRLQDLEVVARARAARRDGGVGRRQRRGRRDRGLGHRTHPIEANCRPWVPSRIGAPRSARPRAPMRA